MYETAKPARLKFAVGEFRKLVFRGTLFFAVIRQTIHPGIACV